MFSGECVVTVVDIISAFPVEAMRPSRYSYNIDLYTLSLSYLSKLDLRVAMTSRPFPPQLMSYDVDAFSPFLQEHPLVSEFHDKFHRLTKRGQNIEEVVRRILYC